MNGILEIREWNLGTLHLMVTSREHGDIEDVMEQFENPPPLYYMSLLGLDNLV